jgi:hypothetical protein
MKIPKKQPLDGPVFYIAREKARRGRLFLRSRRDMGGKRGRKNKMIAAPGGLSGLLKAFCVPDCIERT